MRNKQIRDLFPYIVALILTITFVTLLSLAAGLSASEAALVVVGSAVLVWAGVFTLIQFIRFSKRPGSRHLEKPERDVRRVLMVLPPTGEPQPHHEHHPESPGLDQGQLTCHWPSSTPLVGPDRPGNQQ